MSARVFLRMNRITTIATLALTCVLSAPRSAHAGESPAKPSVPDVSTWRSLFNGKDLAGWETWIRTSDDRTKEPIYNQDPEGIFTVVMTDGEPALRVSGKKFGAIYTKEEFENYHFRIEFKWGDPSGPSLPSRHIESGVLYHAYSPTGQLPGSAIEFNIDRGHVGNYWGVRGPLVDVEGRLFHHPHWPGGTPVVYEKGATKHTKIGARSIFANGNYETHVGEWNVVEILCVGQDIIHVLNGAVAMRLTNARRLEGEKEVPITRGKIHLQSEGAEIFYRRAQIRPIASIPQHYLD
jgi:hypothetical protein